MNYESKRMKIGSFSQIVNQCSDDEDEDDQESIINKNNTGMGESKNDQQQKQIHQKPPGQSIENDFQNRGINRFNASRYASLFSTKTTTTTATKTNLPQLTAALLAAGTTGGTTYAFGLYASALKSTLHLHESELNTISATFFCAGLLSWIPGMAVDKYGPRCAMGWGGVLGAMSLVSYWMVSTGFVYVPRKIVVMDLSILGIMTYMSSSLVTGSVFKIIGGCCGRGSKGVVVGLAKGYVGLGAGAYACLFERVRGENWSDLNFLIMAAFFAIGACTLPAVFLLEPVNENHEEQQHEKEDEDMHHLDEEEMMIGEEDENQQESTSLGENAEKKERAQDPMNNTQTQQNSKNYHLQQQQQQQQSQQSQQEIIDCTNYKHFRLIYAGLIALGAIVVGSSLSFLFFGNDVKDDDDGNYSHTHNNLNIINKWKNYLMAFSIVAIWFGPILCLRFIPIYDNNNNNLTTTFTNKPDLVNDDTYDKSYEDDDHYNYNDHDDHGHEIHIELVKTSTHSQGDDTLSSKEQKCLISHSKTSHNHKSSFASSSIPPTSSSSSSHSSPTPSSCLSYQVQELNTFQMLQTLPAQLLFWTCFILTGGGTVMTNNIGQMVESLHLPTIVASASLALFSAAQAFARVATGALSEMALQKFNLPRPAFLIFASLSGVLAHVLLAFAVTRTFFVLGVILSGIAFGMIWPLIVLVVGELFGNSHMGSNYMFYDGGTSAVGTLLLSKYVAQYVYEKTLEEQLLRDDYELGDDDDNDDYYTHDTMMGGQTSGFAGGEGGSGVSGDGLTCYGSACFEATHHIVAILSITCVLSSVALMIVTRDSYSSSRKQDNNR